MFRHWRYALIGAVVSYFAACAPVEFQGEPPPKCHGSSQVCQRVCSNTSCIEKFKVEQTVGDGLVDILFVDDNSGSMSTEQRKMADKFPDFINSLGKLDYRIGIVTTDISNKYAKSPATSANNGPKPVNGNGAYQDGKLVPFPSGESFITKSSSNPSSLFYQTIQRNETKICEQSGYIESACPSGDERGIYALNLFLDNVASSFMRPTSHFAVVILADEDERGLSDSRATNKDSNGNITANDQDLLRLYPLENYDKGDTFVTKFRSKYPDKSVSVHSIIVRPGDKACVNAQTAQDGNPYVRGIEGYSYANLTSLTKGVLGNICADNFTAQLGQIGSTIANKVTSMNFVCRPINDDFEVTFSPKPSYDIDAVADFNRMVVEFKQTVPANTHITLEYECDEKL